MSTFPVILKKEISDVYAQENFKRIEDYFSYDAKTRCRFEFLELPVPASGTDIEHLHFLGYQPKDIIVMHNLNNATITFKYAKFTDKAIVFDSSAATTLRILIGRYE